MTNGLVQYITVEASTSLQWVNDRLNNRILNIWLYQTYGVWSSAWYIVCVAMK